MTNAEEITINVQLNKVIITAHKNAENHLIFKVLLH